MHTCISRRYKSTNYTLTRVPRHKDACTYAHRDTQTQNTPPGLASAFNYQTDRGEIKTLTHQVGKGEQGSQAVPEAYTCTQVCTRTHRHSSGAHGLKPQLSSRRQAKVYRECKNMTLRGRKKLCSSVRSHVFFFFFSSSCLKGGECVWEGLVNYCDLLLTFISWNDSLLHMRVFPSGLLWVALHIYRRKGFIEVAPSCPHKCLYLRQRRQMSLCLFIRKTHGKCNYNHFDLK